MLLVHKNEKGFIYSYFEFHIVDKAGALKNNGEYMYVADIWVHPDYESKNEINKFIADAEKNEYTKHVEYIYWIRTKWENGKVVHKHISMAFSRKNCLKLKEQ